MTPDAIQRVIDSAVRDAGLVRDSMHRETPAPTASSDVATLIDHTLLRPDAAEAAIQSLCAEGLEHGFASVCVNPCWAAVCAARLRGSRVKLCSVVGFPLGATLPAVKADEARRALGDGAGEIDMVMNIGALKSGHLDGVARDIRGVVDACRQQGGVCKVILETALLSDEEKVMACAVAAASGADYVKTSTGFGPGGATVADVVLMRAVVGSDLGVKASGGIRDLASLRAMVDAGASRIGTSAGVRIVREARGLAVAPAGPGY